jgi:hypothetical protein
MAFSGGNADAIAGKVYWAVSNDGRSWSFYNWNLPQGETWTPVVYGKYASDCQGAPYPESNGVGQLQLAYENGYFYLFISYWHPHQLYPHLSSVAYRFRYAPANVHPFGFGGGNELFYLGSWVPHSGRLVWEYDAGNPEPNEPKLKAYDSMGTYQFGPGDLTWDPRYNEWVHIADWGGARWQVNSSLASPNWHNGSGVAGSYGAVSNMPSNYYTNLGSGLWYGTLGSTTAMWMFMPIDRGGCTYPHRSLSILPARLDRQ